MDSLESFATSSVFGPSQRGPAPDTIVKSSDSVLFYVNSTIISETSPQSMKALCGTIRNDERPSSGSMTVADVPETAAVLGILLHTMYRASCATSFAPSFSDLETAVRRMPEYGLCPKVHIWKTASPTIFDLLLSFSPQHALRIYTLAAQFDIYELAAGSSSYLLSSKALPSLSDEAAEAMGVVYLVRLMRLYLSLENELRNIVMHPPRLHKETGACKFSDQRNLSEAWVIAATYASWESLRPDVASVQDLRDTFLAIARHIQCHRCMEMLMHRVDAVSVQWAKVKRTI